MKNLIALFAAALWLSSCATHTDQCQNEGIAFRLTGFSRTELDTVLIYQYFRNSTIQAKDPMLILAADNFYSGDSATLSRGILADSLDIAVRIPSLNRNIYITNIVSEPRRSESYKVPIFGCVKRDGCYNRLLSYTVDGRRIDGSSSERGSYTLDVQK